MGLFAKLFGKKEEDTLESEIRRYNNENANAKSAFAADVANAATAQFNVDDVFTIAGSYTAAVGTVICGSFSAGDDVRIMCSNGNVIYATINKIEQFRKICETVTEGMNAGFMLSGVERNQLCSGDIIVK